MELISWPDRLTAEGITVKTLASLPACVSRPGMWFAVWDRCLGQTRPNAPFSVFHLIQATALGGHCSFQPHFANKETEAQRLRQDPGRIGGTGETHSTATAMLQERGPQAGTGSGA